MSVLKRITGAADPAPDGEPGSWTDAGGAGEVHGSL